MEHVPLMASSPLAIEHAEEPQNAANAQDGQSCLSHDLLTIWPKVIEQIKLNKTQFLMEISLHKINQFFFSVLRNIRL